MTLACPDGASGERRAVSALMDEPTLTGQRLFWYSRLPPDGL